MISKMMLRLEMTIRKRESNGCQMKGLNPKRHLNPFSRSRLTKYVANIAQQAGHTKVLPGETRATPWARHSHQIGG